MNTYKVTYELTYPDSEEDINEAYVLAGDFRDAQQKVERSEKKDTYMNVRIQKIEILSAKIIV